MKKPYITVEGEFISTEDVQFIDIQEDITGRDVMIFKFNDKVYRSFIVFK